MSERRAAWGLLHRILREEGASRTANAYTGVRYGHRVTFERKIYNLSGGRVLFADVDPDGALTQIMIRRRHRYRHLDNRGIEFLARSNDQYR